MQRRWVRPWPPYRTPNRAPIAVAGAVDERVAVHPASIDRLRTHFTDRLQPGRPTAPEGGRLPLLPSGPDGVHGLSLRGTRLSTSVDVVGDEGRSEERRVGKECRSRWSP